jgi:uncharacterized protein (DUF58 family)
MTHSGSDAIGETTSAWRPTLAHLRAMAGGALLALVAVLGRRPDLLVMATPLLAIAIWTTWSRPTGEPVVGERLGHNSVREGEATSWHVDVSSADGGEDIVAELAVPSFSTIEPASGALCAANQPDGVRLSFTVRSTRWGRRTLGPSRVMVTGAWAGFRWTSLGQPAKPITTLPMPAVFDAKAPAVQPVGLVGLTRSTRPGDGSEFASVRPFQSGDRLRRIHWPRSLRTGTLYVTSTWSDQDSHVVLFIDAFSDVGPTEGIDGRSSSMDVTVRAAAAIAEHHLHRGDRVSMQVVGSRGVLRVPPATGRSHLRRVLDVLAGIEPATDPRDGGRVNVGALAADALVVMLSPLISPMALQRAYTLAMRGMAVIVVDTLPLGISEHDDDDPFVSLAWRIRLLERSREMRRIQQVGVAVVPWRGPGSLDQVLRDLHRRSGAPRLARR